MDRRVLNFRAFFLALGHDLDYTDGINLLAGYGFEKLGEFGFSESLLERVGKHVGLDEKNRRTIASEWARWQKQALESIGQKSAPEGGRFRRRPSEPVNSDAQREAGASEGTLFQV